MSLDPGKFLRYFDQCHQTPLSRKQENHALRTLLEACLSLPISARTWLDVSLLLCGLSGTVASRLIITGFCCHYPAHIHLFGTFLFPFYASSLRYFTVCYWASFIIFAIRNIPFTATILSIDAMLFSQNETSLFRQHCFASSPCPLAWKDELNGLLPTFGVRSPCPLGKSGQLVWILFLCRLRSLSLC